MMFGSDCPERQHPGSAAGAADGSGERRSSTTTDARVFSQVGVNPHHVSVRIVSMQDSNAATTTTTGAGAGSGRRELGTDWTTTTRVSSSTGVTPTRSPPFPSSSFFRSRLWSRAAKASASAICGLSPTALFLPPRHRMPPGQARSYCSLLSSLGQPIPSYPFAFIDTRYAYYRYDVSSTPQSRSH
jgi:hypothetical protein